MIKTTFDASQGHYDADTEYVKHRDRGVEQIRFLLETELVDSYDPVSREFVGLPAWFEFQPPLPPYKDLLAENILPELFAEQDWSRVDEDNPGESESEADSEDDANADADADADADDVDDDSEDKFEADDDEVAAQEQGDSDDLAQGSHAWGSAIGVNQVQSSSNFLGDESDDDDAMVYYSDHSD